MATPRSSLHAVPTPGQKASTKRRTTVLQRAAKKTRRDMLVALRNRIAADIDAGVPARDLAALSRRLMDIAAEIDVLDAIAGGAPGQAGQPPAQTGIAAAVSEPDERF